MARQRNVWLGMLAIVGALIVGACADSAPSPVPPPLIGERSEAGMGSLSQPIVIMLVTPTPSAGESTSESAGSSQEGEAADSAPAESEGEAAGQAEMSDKALIDSGEEVYANSCATCHGPDGQGGGSFPPLAGSALVTDEDFSGALTTVLHGRGQMPSFADQLADEEIAAVLSYIRNAWDHDASVVKVSDVSQAQEGDPAADTGDEAAGDQAEADQADPDQEAQTEVDGDATEASAAAEESAQPDESQPSTGQSGDQQASTTVSTDQGTITIQLQVVVVTPEPQAGTGDSGAEDEAAPLPSEEDANGDEAAPPDDSDAEDEAAPPPSEDAIGSQAAAVIQIIITIDDAGNVAVQQSSGSE